MQRARLLGGAVAAVEELGWTNVTGGAYSPFVAHITREDGSQEFGQITVTLPPGATGKLAGIPECSQAQIAQAESRKNAGEGALEAASPSCPESSKIGTVIVAAGAGPKPFYETGSAYLAGPYKGAPFSAVFITPAIAGPFDLGTVVVRAGLYINPNTAQVTVASDQLPRILDGIPLDIRSITVDASRSQFTLNPTNCNPMTVTGEETSTSGQVASLSDRFQASDCGNLKFAPKFTVSTAGKTSKALGASLTTKIEEPAGALGTQADIAKVKVQLPLQLPSELKTLNKACLAKTFEENPANCSPHSIVGHAVVHTPLLAEPLVGPAYFVSHGNEAFPSLTMVLQGNGVTIDLVGATNITKGITTTTFKTVPDVPFSTFELTLPQGEYSALGRNLPASVAPRARKTGDSSLTKAPDRTWRSGAPNKTTRGPGSDPGPLDLYRSPGRHANVHIGGPAPSRPQPVIPPNSPPVMCSVWPWT